MQSGCPARATPRKLIAGGRWPGAHLGKRRLRIYVIAPAVADNAGAALLFGCLTCNPLEVSIVFSEP
jgi:hypothetical protein